MKNEAKYIRGQHRYRLHFVLKDGGFVASRRIYADSQAELDNEVKRLVGEIRDWGRSEEVVRVYSTRIDCPAEPEGVRQAV